MKMAWENQIVGYRIAEFVKSDVIPPDAVFLTTRQRFVGMYGWASNPQPHYETVFEYQVPVYKKLRVKRK